MHNQEQDMRQEQLHFQECLDIIGQNVVRYEQEYEQRHAQAQELYKAVSSGDVELYNQLMTTTSLEEHAATSAQEPCCLGQTLFRAHRLQGERRGRRTAGLYRQEWRVPK